MAKQTRGGGFTEAKLRQERDKTQVGKFARIFQTIHGLIDAEDDRTLSVLAGANEGEEREAGEDSRGVRVNVNSNELTLRERKGDGSAKVEVGEVGGAKKGILRHHRVQANVDGSEGGNVGRGRTGGGKTVTANTTVAALWAREEERGRGALLLRHGIVVGGGGGGVVDGAEGAGSLDELNELVAFRSRSYFWVLFNKQAI